MMFLLIQQPVRDLKPPFPCRGSADIDFAARHSGTRPSGSAMTAVSTFDVFVSADSEIFGAGELIDGLIEAVVLPRDPRARSAVIYHLVHEMCVAVEWLNASYPVLDGATDDELLSLRQVGLAAKDHHERMRTLAPAGAGVSSP
jgi:hypothetical protein